MNKTELVATVAEKSGMTKADAARAIDATLETITETMASGDQVALIGFGTFKTATRAARSGRNPKTGEVMQIAEATVPRFAAGKSLKDAVNK